MTPNDRPPYFFLKKYSIMAFTIVQIILMIIFAIIAGIAIGAVNSASVHGDKETATWVLIFSIVICVLGILFQSIGLFGAWKENYCLSVTYAVLSALSVVFNLVAGISVLVYFLPFVISILVTIATILFCRDLRQIRLGQVPPTTY